MAEYDSSDNDTELRCETEESKLKDEVRLTLWQKTLLIQLFKV